MNEIVSSMFITVDLLTWRSGPYNHPMTVDEACTLGTGTIPSDWRYSLASSLLVGNVRCCEAMTLSGVVTSLRLL